MDKATVDKAAAELLAEALKLPPEARAKIAASLIESLDEEADADAAQAWEAEIARRVEELDSGTAETISWEEVERRLDKRLRR